MKILIIDNYDSFTYNLFHLVKSVSKELIDIFKNDQIELDEIKKYDKIILSPGPDLPSKSGKLLDIIKNYHSEKSILGVCLGHQAIAESFGSQLINTEKVYHGVDSIIQIIDSNERIFNHLPNRIKVGRYHSWVVDPIHLSPDLKITAIAENQTIMAISHQKYDVKGLQFHPESYMTEFGAEMMSNWLRN